jgi:predicted membrane protein
MENLIFSIWFNLGFLFCIIFAVALYIIMEEKRDKKSKTKTKMQQ